MGLDTEENDADELIALSEFIDHFNVHYMLLLRRYKRFRKIDDISNTDIDVITYFDMILVQIRSMCIENEGLKKNYTVQNLLRKVAEPELAEKLDDMLNEEFLTGVTDFTIKRAIKILTDGFICHYDNFDGTANDVWAMAAIIEKQLRNPYDKHNLEYIMSTIIDCVGNGLTIK